MATFSHIDLANENDNEALLELTRSADMKADIGMCIERAPSFFKLNELEGDPWWVWVARDTDGKVMGCIAQANRKVHINGKEETVIYCSDLKVFPEFRGSQVANELLKQMGENAEKFGGQKAQMYMSILEGNTPVQDRDYEGLNLPILKRFSSFNICSIPVLWKRSQPHADKFRVRSATEDDVPAMLELWKGTVKQKQLSPVLELDEWKDWVTRSPGLEWSDYQLVIDADNNIRAFSAFWEQSSFKQTKVTYYTTPLKIVKAVFNSLAPLFGAPGLPQPGNKLSFLSALHFCVPASDLEAAKTLVWSGYMQSKKHQVSFLSLGLDTKDQITGALKSFYPQNTLVNVYGAYPEGQFDKELDHNPVHFEIALV